MGYKGVLRATLLGMALLMSLTITTDTSVACINPTDSFATEVLLNKPWISYDLATIRHAENVTVYGNSVVLTEIEESHVKGLSVRVQVPTREVYIKSPYVRVEDILDIRMADLDVFAAERLGWKVWGTEEMPMSRGGMNKGSIGISISAPTSPSEVGTLITIRVDKSTSLIDQMKSEIETVLASIGVEDPANIVTDVNIQHSLDDLTDLESAVPIDGFDWGEAMETELVWLRDNGVVTGLSEADIDGISSMCVKGTAGYNSRVVFENGKWILYFKTENPLLLRASDCSGFSITNLPSGELAVLEDVTTAGPWSYWWWSLILSAIGISAIVGYAVLRRERKTAKIS